MHDVGTRHRLRSSFSTFRFAIALAALFLALHLPYLPASLEDLDSINFALGVRHFDVAHHQPHPPGYPLFIALAKGTRPLAGSEARALALDGIVAGALAIFALRVLFRRLDGDGSPVVATALAITAPLYWFTTNRPLSDMTGLAAALCAQAMLLSAATPRGLALAAFCAGLAAGLRSQVFWLTAPLLAWVALKDGATDSGKPARAGPATSAPSNVPALQAAVAYAIGVAAWAVPLVAISGGPRAYWHAVTEQGAEDLSGIRMLWTTPTVRELIDAMYYAFVAPWALWPLAAVVLALAAIGIVSLSRRRRGALVLAAVAFGPYLIFDLLFQETFTSRYALPLVVPMAWLASAGAQALPANAGLAVAAAAAMFGAHVGGTSLAAYSRQPAPAFRLLEDMRRAESAAPPVLALDRREALDLRRPIAWVGDRLPALASQLPSPPQHEWLEPVKYWNGGGRAPVWFVADPKRTDVDLLQHGEARRYRWALPYPVLLDGTRPNEMDWYEIDSPDWWVEDGWALTPETAGVSTADRAGLARGPIAAHLGAATAGGVVLIGGRNLEPGARPRLDVDVDGTSIGAFDVAPGAFVRSMRLPTALARASTLTVRATPPANVALEQFDASASRPLVAFEDGWHEPEYNPASGARWRWLSRRGQLGIVWPAPAQGLVLRVAGESPLKYFSRPSTLTVRADDAVVLSTELRDDFSLVIPIARAAATITLETDQAYVPAERSRRTRDRRELGLRILSCDVRPVSARGR